MSIDSTLLAIAPEFSASSEADRQAIINLAANSVGNVFGNQKELATAYLAAHMLTISQRAGAGGAVRSMKEGDLSLTFGDGGNAATGLYNSTSYGMEYERMLKSSVFAARTRAV